MQLCLFRIVKWLYVTLHGNAQVCPLYEPIVLFGLNEERNIAIAGQISVSLNFPQ